MRVLLADDHTLFRAGITSLLTAWGIEVVGEASDGLEALALVRSERPDVVLMDIAMPNCSGLEATRLIKAELPETTIVIVTVSDDDADLFEAIKAGAAGYLLKDMSDEELAHTLHGIEAGRAALSPQLAARILEEFTRRMQDHDDAVQEPELTGREREVLALIADGLTNREIACRLTISENTVSFHVKNILGKLHLKNRAQAVAYAIRTGLAKLPPPEAD